MLHMSIQEVMCSAQVAHGWAGRVFVGTQNVNHLIRQPCQLWGLCQTNRAASRTKASVQGAQNGVKTGPW